MQSEPKVTKSKLYQAYPLIMTYIGSVVITTLAAIHLWKNSSVDNLYLGWAVFITYAVWKILERKITRKEAQDTEENNDQHTLDICIAAENLLLLSVYIPNSRIYLSQVIAGLIIMAVGLPIRINALQSLGEQYSLRIRKIKSKPVDKGIYRFIRHPAYLGTIIMHTGLIMIGCNVFSVIALVFWYAAVINRAIVEDKYLLTFKEYKRYSGKVKWRLLPYIW